jgi:hypothetical protein
VELFLIEAKDGMSEMDGWVDEGDSIKLHSPLETLHIITRFLTPYRQRRLTASRLDMLDTRRVTMALCSVAARNLTNLVLTSGSKKGTSLPRLAGSCAYVADSRRAAPLFLARMRPALKKNEWMS